MLFEKTSFFLPLEAVSRFVSELAAITAKPIRGFLTLPLMEFLLVGVVELGRLILEDIRLLLLMFFSPVDLRRLS